MNIFINLFSVFRDLINFIADFFHIFKKTFFIGLFSLLRTQYNNRVTKNANYTIKITYKRQKMS